MKYEIILFVGDGTSGAVATVSLVLNLVAAGFFIAAVKKLLQTAPES